MGKIEIFQGKNKQWYFRIRANNGKIVAQSEGYTQKWNAYKGIRSIRAVMLGPIDYSEL